MSMKLSALAMAAGMAFAAPAFAACNVTDLTINASSCAGTFGDNDTAADVDAAFGPSWVQVAKVEFDDDFGGTIAVDFSTAFVVALKAGSGRSGAGFNLYKYDSGYTGFLAVNATPGGKDLSHYTLYAPVPEPETYALMLAGLAAVGFVARRRKV
jgi:hypothetical protein